MNKCPPKKMRWLNRSPLQNKFAWSSAICVPSGCLNSLLTRGLFARLTDREGRGKMKISWEKGYDWRDNILDHSAVCLISLFFIIMWCLHGNQSETLLHCVFLEYETDWNDTTRNCLVPGVLYIYPAFTSKFKAVTHIIVRGIWSVIISKCSSK